MHSFDSVVRVRELASQGVTAREISRLTGVPFGTVQHWRNGSRRSERVEERRRSGGCFRCNGTDPPADYPYVLGMYLGDGHIVVGRREVESLSIFCDDGWPGIKADVTAALGRMLGTSVCHVQMKGCTAVKAYSKHWTCLFPQHGPGMKHTRPIVLERWQQAVVDHDPGAFLRGLFHSDGCRITNWTVRKVAGKDKRYEYPRWCFSNESIDILGLCSASLDRMGIAHRKPRRNLISVARKEAVEIMDRVVGPKT